MLKNRLFTSVFMMLAMAGVVNAAYNGTPETPSTDTDGCYLIGSAEELYGFADMVNGTLAEGRGAEPTACGKLTADIVVNTNVLGTDNANVNADGSYNNAQAASGFRVWTPIGTDEVPFAGTFDGLGHTISGLYFNAPDVPNVGLFGYVSGEDVTVSIGNVGVEDSYFNAQSAVGGVVGNALYVALNMKNVYNAAVVVGAYEAGGIVGDVSLDVQTLSMVNVYNVGSISGTEEIDGKTGGLVGFFMKDSEESAVSIKNSYNYGNVDGGNPLVGLVDITYEDGDENVSVTNSYYLGEAAQGDYGTVKSSTEFADGTVYVALHSAEGGEGWLQYADDAYPTLIAKTGTGAPAPMHVAVLHYSETDSVVIAYTEGETLTLPTEDNGGNPIAGWTTSADGTGDAITEIPTSATTDLKLYAKVETFKPNAEGYYEIATADDLYKFAEIVNSGAVTNAKAKLTADICVNACGEGESVLGTDNANVNTTTGAYIGSTTGLREWIPIGFGKDNENIVSFNGLFDGQGHSISGLYFNKADAQYVGLFGTLSTATIKNVGVEDSYFKGSDCIGGILGIVDIDAGVNIENVYNAAVVVGGNRAGGIIGGDFGNESHVTNAYNVGMVLSINETAGGIVGYNYSVEPTTIQNSFNYGSVSAGSGTAGALIGEVEDEDDDAAGFSVSNSYYLGSEANGDYGEFKSASEFADGTVLAALRGADESGSWYQYQGDAFPVIFPKDNATGEMHVVTLRYSDTDLTYIAYVQGVATSLPTEDKDGNAIIGWAASADGTGDVITEIPASATTDLKLYPKFNSFEPNADGYYEITSADDLYKFAELVNSDKERDAKAKLMNDIVVNQNVLGTDNANVDADGNYIGADSASFRKWTPIGSSSNPFKGSFDGQGYTISGLYCNGTSRTAGLFGYVDGTSGQKQAEVSIQNIGVEDSYFKAEIVDGKATYAGGILAYVGENGNANLENVYSSAVAVAPCAGGVVGYFYGYNLNMTNVFNTGSIFATTHGSGLVGAIYSSNQAVINNSYNYGTFKEGDGALIGFRNGGPLPSVTNSYYLASEQVGDYGTNKSADDFANGDVFVALHSAEGGYVWVQAPGDKYPTIEINATNANTVVLDWNATADSTTLAAAGYTDSAMVIVKDGKQFYAGGAIYEGILSAAQVAAIGSNKLYPISGVELETVEGKLVATLNGDSQDAVMIPTDVHVDKVVYNRDVATASYKTVMLPFSVPVSAVSGFTFYKFRKVDYNEHYNRDVVYVKKTVDKLEANTPYIMIASSSSSQIVFVAEDGFTLNTAGTYETSYDAGSIIWKMKGVYESKVWENGDEELGFVYGFADQNQDGYKIGDFTKLGDGASIVPMRVYMVAEEKPVNARLGLTGKAPFARVRELPENMTIVIDDDESDEIVEETTIVKHITVVPTVVQANRWFDLRGRALNGKPTAKGTYCHNGQRIIIK